MKKKYTKKQITEAIAYWEKQLKAGNYKKIDESFPIACSNDNTGIMCYTHIYSAYNNGDEDWLFVAPNMNAFIDGFVETANNEYTAIVIYNGNAAKVGTPEFKKLMSLIRKESLDNDSAVHIKWINSEEPYNSINVNNYTENDGEDMDINFYDCTTSDHSEWSPDGQHILICL